MVTIFHIREFSARGILWDSHIVVPFKVDGDEEILLLIVNSDTTFDLEILSNILHGVGNGAHINLAKPRQGDTGWQI